MLSSLSEYMFIFTTMTPPSFKWAFTAEKNSTVDIWNGMVMS